MRGGRTEEIMRAGGYRRPRRVVAKDGRMLEEEAVLTASRVDDVRDGEEAIESRAPGRLSVTSSARHRGWAMLVTAVVLLVASAPDGESKTRWTKVRCGGYAPQISSCTKSFIVPNEVRELTFVYGNRDFPEDPFGEFNGRIRVEWRSETAHAVLDCVSLVYVFYIVCPTDNTRFRGFRPGQTVTMEGLAQGVGFWRAFTSYR